MPELRPGTTHRPEKPDSNPAHKLKKVLAKIMTLFTPIKFHLKPREKPPEDRHDQDGQETMGMTVNINILGVCQPEKLAQGMCPCCKSMIELWLLPQGVEITLPGQEYDVETPSK
jgi:hypothetical protein